MVVICSLHMFPSQACRRQTDYWQFVKDIRWLSPHSALHVEKVRVRAERLCWQSCGSSLFEAPSEESSRLLREYVKLPINQGKEINYPSRDRLYLLKKKNMQTHSSRPLFLLWGRNRKVLLFSKKPAYMGPRVKLFKAFPLTVSI